MKHSFMYKYSIIIPHHNCPELLQLCLDSIPKREDVQVIVVDDNSDSNKVDFAHFPGLNAPNTEVYLTKEGRGAGYARNVGLEHAKGEWLLFADSDDYYATENLNELLDTDYSAADAVAWFYEMIQGERHVVYGDFNGQTVTIEDMFRMNEPWRKMVKRSVVEKHGIKFQESMVSNDLMFSLTLANVCKSFAWHDKVIYRWIRRPQSLTGGYSGKKLYAALDVSIGANRFLKSVGKEKYFDRTGYYLSIVWQDSKLKYWWYLLKICCMIGYKAADKFNRDACEMQYMKVNVLAQMFDALCVRLGALKNNIK